MTPAEWQDADKLRKRLLELHTLLGTAEGMLRGLVATCEIDPAVRERIEKFLDRETK